MCIYSTSKDGVMNCMSQCQNNGLQVLVKVLRPIFKIFSHGHNIRSGLYILLPLCINIPRMSTKERVNYCYLLLSLNDISLLFLLLYLIIESNKRKHSITSLQSIHVK